MNEQTPAIRPEDRNMAMACHLAALIGLLIPFGTLLGPLVLWLLKKDQSPFIDEQGKEAINFNITMLLAGIVSAVLTMVLVGFLLLAVVGIAWLVLTIVAAVKVSNGQSYRYPFTLRLVK
ncbi:DUF4870 domain-containing protein [Isoalcanivorax beigongshangi]|uniref:DUF4870 domain-containing protein n=1 Tax=Isoalcanivorax beigongshangi TaxID=3238810 RepID=A0ABV4AED4_9GAMM